MTAIHMKKYRFKPAFEVRKGSPEPPQSTEGELPRRRPECNWFVCRPDPEMIARKKAFMDKLKAEMAEWSARRKLAEEKQAKLKQAKKQAKKNQAKEKRAKKKQWKKENQAKENQAKKLQAKRKQAKKKQWKKKL